MMAIVAGNELILGLVLAVALVLVVWLWRRGRRGGARVRFYAPDALDEGAAPAVRNQALIDAVRAVGVVPVAGVAPVAAGGDDLTRIKGVGPKLAVLLASLGVTQFSQIAAWGPDDVARIDAELGTFAGRIARDSWVEQCGFLAAGDVTGFEARFGRV